MNISERKAKFPCNILFMCYHLRLSEFIGEPSVKKDSLEKDSALRIVPGPAGSLVIYYVLKK